MIFLDRSDRAPDKLLITAPQMCNLAPMLNWDDLRIFVAVADTGSLTAASRRLGVDHATVGRRLASLEAALGVRLVDRLPKGTPLTNVGAEFAELARSMADAAERLQRRARDASTSLSGTVTISAPPVLASHFIAGSLGSLRERYPGLAVSLSGDVGLVSLEQRQADIAVRLVRPDHLSHIARAIGAVHLGLYAAPLMAAMPPTDWAFIGYDAALAHVPHHHWFERYAGDRAVVMRSSDVNSQIAAARSGLGVAMLPRFMAAPDPELAPVDPDATPPVRTIWLVTHADIRKSPAVRAVADHLITLFAKAPAFAPD